MSAADVAASPSARSVAQLWRFVTAMGPTAVALGVQFVTFAITARGLGVEAFGQYAALLGLAAIGVELVGWGGADLMVRAVARTPERFPSYYGNMLMLMAATLPLVSVGMVGVAIGGMRTEIGWQLVLVALFAEIAIGRVSASIELAMVAHGHTTRASFIRLNTASIRLIAAGFYFLLFHGLSGWIVAVFVQSATLSIVYLILARWLYGKPLFHLHRAELGDGGTFMINQSARAMQGNVDRVVLARFASDAAVGAYAAGSRLLLIGLFPLQVMTRLLYPNFFRHGEQGIAATRRYALKCLPAMLGVGFFSLAGVIAVAQIVPFALGHDFYQSRFVAMLLALSLPLIAMQYLAADTLTGAGFQHLRAIVYGIAALVFGLVLALGARFGGIDGLIVAYLLAHAALAAVLWALAFLIPDAGAAPRPSNR
jgi:O-antigen/teichoic acid export membrane protein